MTTPQQLPHMPTMSASLYRNTMEMLALAGDGLDRMEQGKMHLEPAEYAHIAGACRNMIIIMPKNSIEFIQLVQKHPSLRDILESLTIDYKIATDSDQVAVLHDVLVEAMKEESLGNCDEARHYIRRIMRKSRS